MSESRPTKDQLDIFWFVGGWVRCHQCSYPLYKMTKYEDQNIVEICNNCNLQLDPRTRYN